ncbi:MAG: hypothetical protein ABF255_02405 [Planktotalea arctica]|uniref:hypothetical protein n=1 Tax=Planktotalea arctica TaxID=1481893 RepID=UPI00321C1D90
MQGFNGDPELKGEVEAAYPAAHQALRATGSGGSSNVWHLGSPELGPTWAEFRCSEAQREKGGGKAETGGDAPNGCRSLISLSFCGVVADRAHGAGRQRTFANCPAQSRSDPKLVNLQDFAVFQRVLRAFTGIRPTGKGSGPLPVIDFKQNLQNQALFWERDGLWVALWGARPNPLLGGFALRDESRTTFFQWFQ